MREQWSVDEECGRGPLEAAQRLSDFDDAEIGPPESGEAPRPGTGGFEVHEVDGITVVEDHGDGRAARAATGG